MFKFEKDRMYQMPVHFGPMCSPRQDQFGKRYLEYGPQESEQHTLVYETDPKALENYLPEGFSVRLPYIYVVHKMHRNLPWLAGHGYNVVTVNASVTFTGKEGTVKGRYQLAIWENHGDPILSGREQLGYSKLFATIEDMHTFRGVSKAALFSWGFKFLQLSFDKNSEPAEKELFEKLISDPENEGLMHYKYCPSTGNGFSEADIQYVTISPAKFVPPYELPPVPAPERSLCGASLQWNVPAWEDMPTQYQVVQGLASLPITKVIGAMRTKLYHYNDVYDQRIVR